jgi:DNA-binding response OmpR family regulator
MKILLIEDDAFFQKFYAMKLAEQQITVEVAKDGEEGLAKMRTFQPNIVLLDLVMPKKNGFEVLEEMVKEPSIKSIPVLVFSTLGQESDIARAKSLGAKEYVNKTFFDFDKLLARIKALAQ